MDISSTFSTIYLDEGNNDLPDSPAPRLSKATLYNDPAHVHNHRHMNCTNHFPANSNYLHFKEGLTVQDNCVLNRNLEAPFLFVRDMK